MPKFRKTNDPILGECPDRTTEGQALFYSTIPATAGGFNKLLRTKLFLLQIAHQTLIIAASPEYCY